MTAGTVRLLRKPLSSPNTSGQAPLKKKASAAGVKSITLNEMGWKFQIGIRTFRTAIVFFLKRRMGRSRIDRGTACQISKPDCVASAGMSSSMDIHSSYPSFCIPSGGSMTITNDHVPCR
ncbi:hypothetical protein AVEN_51003-1 [Araneus ventricosus]|uniref:Uncharacterized protein n=1 Tax=Araneus ventricosus TaxID=182803 RepID=A0A4Y2N632_ARAVE|nr:hypothetical protein AVEN_51003-1 [Araneus ventricosus]